MNIIIRILVVAAIAYGLANLIPGVSINTYGTAVLVAVVLSLLDFFIKPVKPVPLYGICSGTRLVLNPLFF